MTIPGTFPGIFCCNRWRTGSPYCDALNAEHIARQVIVIKKATNSEPGMFLNPRHFPHALDSGLLRHRPGWI